MVEDFKNMVKRMQGKKKMAIFILKVALPFICRPGQVVSKQVSSLILSLFQQMGVAMTVCACMHMCMCFN